MRGAALTFAVALAAAVLLPFAAPDRAGAAPAAGAPAPLARAPAPAPRGAPPVARPVAPVVPAPAPIGPAAAPVAVITDLLPSLPNPLPVIGNAVGGLAKISANTVLDAFASWVTAGAASFIGTLAAAINRSTNAGDITPWFKDHFDVMAEIALDFAAPLLFAAAITAIVRRDLAVLLRAAFVHLPLAFLGTAAAMVVVGAALLATDELCSKVTAHTSTDATQLLHGLVQVLQSGGSGVTGFGLVIVAVLIAMGGFFLTIELVVREAAIWVAMLFLPLGLIGLLWPGTARWGRRLAELLVVLILSKFVIVAIVSMAVSATAHGVAFTDASPLFGGAALLLLAAAAPFTLLRMVPVVEAGVIAHLEGVGRRAASVPPGVKQMAQQSAHSHIARMLERRESPGGPPSGPPGPASVDRGAEAVATRGRDADGTQSGPDKPVPAVASATQWRNAVRVVGASSGAPPVPVVPPPPSPGPRAGNEGSIGADSG